MEYGTFPKLATFQETLKKNTFHHNGFEGIYVKIPPLPAGRGSGAACTPPSPHSAPAVPPPHLRCPAPAPQGGRALPLAYVASRLQAVLLAPQRPVQDRRRLREAGVEGAVVQLPPRPPPRRALLWR